MRRSMERALRRRAETIRRDARRGRAEPARAASAGSASGLGPPPADAEARFGTGAAATAERRSKREAPLFACPQAGLKRTMRTPRSRALESPRWDRRARRRPREYRARPGQPDQNPEAPRAARRRVRSPGYTPVR